MGSWLEINGESVYGTHAFTLPNNLHDWGKITYKKTETGSNLYLHVFNWPLNKKLYLTGIKTKPEKVYLLADKQKSPLKFDHSDVLTTIKLSELKPDPLISVIVVEYKNDPVTEEGLVAKSVDGGYSMLPQNQIVKNESLAIFRKDVEGTVPEHVNVKEPQTFRWKIYIDVPGEKSVDVSYSFQNNTSNSK